MLLFYAVGSLLTMHTVHLAAKMEGLGWRCDVAIGGSSVTRRCAPVTTQSDERRVFEYVEPETGACDLKKVAS
jgi:hypothetical protein